MCPVQHGVSKSLAWMRWAMRECELVIVVAGVVVVATLTDAENINGGGSTVVGQEEIKERKEARN